MSIFSSMCPLSQTSQVGGCMVHPFVDVRTRSSKPNGRMQDASFRRCPHSIKRVKWEDIGISFCKCPHSIKRAKWEGKESSFHRSFNLGVMNLCQILFPTTRLGILNKGMQPKCCDFTCPTSLCTRN